MKKLILLSLSILLIADFTDAQTTKKKATAKKKKTVQKTASPKTAPVVIDPVNTDVLIKNEDGGSATEPLKQGDQLVYAVKSHGTEYDFIVTLNKYNSEDGIDFNYEMTNEAHTSGHVVISADAKYNARKYINFFKGGELTLTDAITVWMSGIAFSEMPEKKTIMTFDNEETPETMYRPENDEVAPIINFRGKPVAVDAFIINNAPDGKGSKTMWVAGISSGPLIVKLDFGWSVLLKEIR